MQAREGGLPLVFEAVDQQGSPFSVAGATCTVEIIYPDGTAVATLSATPNSSPVTLPNQSVIAPGFAALRTSLSTDFLVGGSYKATLIADFGSGRVRQSAQSIIVVGDAPNADTLIPVGVVSIPDTYGLALVIADALTPSTGSPAPVPAVVPALTNAFLTEIRAASLVADDGSTIFVVSHNGTPIATVHWTASALAMTVPVSPPLALAAGDVLSLAFTAVGAARSVVVSGDITAATA